MAEDVCGFLVSGRVQGVGFRWWCRHLAERLGVRGTVRNREDGTVEVVAAGPRGALQSLRMQLASGPPGARVESVSEFSAETAPLPDGFEIVR